MAITLNKTAGPASAKKTKICISTMLLLLSLSILAPGCARFERWKTGILTRLYHGNIGQKNAGMQFMLEGEHSKIGVKRKEGLQDLPMWRADITMDGPGLNRGDAFRIRADVKILDGEILKILEKSRADELYMIAVISPLYDKAGHFRQFTNIQMSCLLTPTGFPIETLQESIPSVFKGNHFKTPWEIVVKQNPSKMIHSGEISFSAKSAVPEILPDGHYRMGFEFGAKIKGRFVKLELIPYLGSILIKEKKSKSVYLTANATERTGIRILHSPVFTIGRPEPPKMPWTLFGSVVTHGARGIVAREDKEHFAVSYSGLRHDKIIVPMRDHYGRMITYKIEPDFPTQNKAQEFFEKTMYYGSLETILSHIQMDPIKLNYVSGYLEAKIHTPSGKEIELGKAPFNKQTKTGASTEDPRFNIVFREYGHYVIEMKGAIADQDGRLYFGGGRYDVWVAQPLSMSTSSKPGMPYEIGNAYSPRISIHPGVSADVEYEVKLYRNSSKKDVKTWKHKGRASRYGYYYPKGPYEPMIFDSQGEYIANVTVTYRDEDGGLWMGSQTSAGVVADPGSDMTVHGDIMFFQSRPFDPRTPVDFRPRFELKAGGYAGSPEINDMTMTQVRMGMPYNSGDVLFFSPALLWNVGEIYPLLSFSTTDNRVTREVLNNFPPFDQYIGKHFGETMSDINNCWGRIYAVDTCDSVLLSGVDSSIHKSASNLPVMSRAKNGLQPHAFQYEPEILNYYYSSSIKPGMLSRYVVSDSTNSTSYWIVTPNFFGRQFGSGENGDVSGDIYHFMGGVVYRNLARGINKYGIYHSTGIVGDARDENNRVEEPLKSPLVRAGGKDYDMFAGMSPEQGTIYETGDRIVGGGFIAPSIPADYEFQFVPPEGKPIVEKGRTNRFGLFKVLGQGVTARVPGLYKVYFKLSEKGREGTTLGRPDGWYHLYVVEKNSPYEIKTNIPRMAAFDITDALEIKGALPGEWNSGKIYYTVISPGVVYSQGELVPDGRNFKYRFMPLHANVFYPSLEVFDIVNNQPGFWDTVVITIFADGKSKDGKRITAAADILVRGNMIFNQNGARVSGPPPRIVTTKMYEPFSIDTSEYAYSDNDIKNTPPAELIRNKCRSCHSAVGGNRTYSEWKKIVNWHADRNPLWLRDSNRRSLTAALHKLYPSLDAVEEENEKSVINQGAALFKRRCLSCHPNEPVLNRTRSLTGWNNIIIRHEYWETKWGGEKIFHGGSEKKTLAAYLDLVAGAETALPADNPMSSRNYFQNMCFRCHSTILRTYNWQKGDRTFLERHIKLKFSTEEQARASKVVDYLYP